MNNEKELVRNVIWADKEMAAFCQTGLYIKLSSKNEELNELRRYFKTICNFYSGVT